MVWTTFALLAAALSVPEPSPTLPLGLEWSAPAACGGRAQLVADIERLAGATVDGRGPVVAQGVIVTTTTGYALDLLRRDPDGTTIERRHLEAGDCRVLSNAAALILSVSVAPLRVASVVAETLEESQSPQPAVLVTEPPDREASATGRTKIREPGTSPGPRQPESIPPPQYPRRSARPPLTWDHRFIAGGLVGAAVGVVPRPSVVLGGWAGYAFGPLRLELSGEHTFKRSVSLADGVGLEASTSGGGVTVVFAPRLGPVVAWLGLGLRAGALRGEGTGARVEGRETIDWWAAVPLVAGVTWPPDSRIALRAQVEFSVAARQPAIEIRSGTEVVGGFRQPLAAFIARIGPELRLP